MLVFSFLSKGSTKHVGVASFSDSAMPVGQFAKVPVFPDGSQSNRARFARKDAPRSRISLTNTI
jgi:hypothetical protein